MAIELTPSAARRIQQQLKQRGHGVGLRLGISKTGCSGYGYKLDYAEQVAEDDTVFDQHGATLVVRSEDLELLDGLRVDIGEVKNCVKELGEMLEAMTMKPEATSVEKAKETIVIDD